MLDELKAELNGLERKKKALKLQQFFKTGEGEYGYGDVFLGIAVPVQRVVAKKYKLSLDEIQDLLNSDIHEYRLVSLFILIDKYKKLNKKQNAEVFDFYLKNAKRVNNWDLVDLSAPNIAGDYLVDNKNERGVLYKLAKSDNLWEKRIAMMACFSFIKNNDFDDALKIAEILLNDEHDLIHKAVGWMLREIGKRKLSLEEKFLRKYHKTMPRTMLRYAIEKFDEPKRMEYMGKD